MTLVVLLLVGVAAVVAALGRPALTLGVLLGTIMLLPASMVLPYSPTSAATGMRLIEVGAVVGALRAPRPPVRGVPHVLLPLLLYAVTACVTGIALADARVDAVEATYSWLHVLDQVVVALVALRLCRLLSSAHVVALVTLGATLGAVVGLGEWATGISWSRKVLQAAQPGAGGVAAQVLETRNGALRVRGATEFALAYGWLLAALLPVVVVAWQALRGRVGLAVRLVLAAGTPLVIAGVVLSRGRSPLAAALAIVVVLLALLAPRRAPYMVLLALLLVGGVYWLGPDVLHRLSPSTDQGSVDVRVHRLPHVLELAAAHPFHGTGLSGVQRFGPGFVDSSYLQVYVEMGAVAVSLLVLALAAPVLAVARGLWRGLHGSDALLALGSGVGMATLGVGSVFFDGFTTLSTALTFWVLAAAGLVAAERRAGPLGRPGLRDVLTPARLLLVVLAVGAGFGIRSLAPTHATGSAVYATVDVNTQVTTDPPGVERALVTTACQAARDGISPGQPWRLTTCEELQIPGWFRLEVTAPDAEQAGEGLAALHDGFRTFPHLLGLREERGIAIVSGIPTPARVAPLALGLLAGAVVLLLPGRRRTRTAPAARSHDNM